MNRQLPKNWRMVKMGEVFTIERGGSPRPIDDFITDDINGINWIKIGDTKNIVKYIYTTKEKIRPEGVKRSRMVYEDDFILSNSMSFGRPYIMKTTGCIHDGWLVIRKNETIDNNFLYYLLSSSVVFQQFTNLAKGSTVKNLNIEAVKKVELNIPPKPTQLSIVSKIEELFSELDKGLESLLTAKQQLKTYRQSVLKWAFEGKLTNENVKEEELPEGWRMVRIEDATISLDNKRKPINKEERKKRVGNIPYYGANGQVGWIDDYIFNEPLVCVVEDETFTGREIPFSYKITGKTWVNNHAHVLKPKDDLNIDFLNYQLYYYPFLRLTTGTTGRKKLTKNALMNAPIKVCSLGDQNKIVQEIESRLSVTDKMEESITQSLLQAEALRQSILKKAFEGKLI
jgi:type I restriction enzyme S subunit